MPREWLMPRGSVIVTQTGNKYLRGFFVLRAVRRAHAKAMKKERGVVVHAMKRTDEHRASLAEFKKRRDELGGKPWDKKRVLLHKCKNLGRKRPVSMPKLKCLENE